MESSTVRIVLAESKRAGLTFEEAWFRALRQIVPPPGCPPDVRAEHESDKALWREAKEHWRAAYEGRAPDPEHLAVGMADARRRLRDVLLADARRADEELPPDGQLAALRREARSRGISDAGNVDDLRRRVTAWELAREAEAEARALAVSSPIQAAR